jgi:hypothetical protein
MDIEEIIYTARDNTIELSLSTDGEPIAHTSVTRCQVKVDNTLLDSAVNPTYFDRTHTDRIILKFGDAGLIAGTYTAKLYIFDVSSVEGLYWGDFTLTVTS